MTNLHSLPKITDKKAKRLGRGLGSGAGAKSGRGTTRHQKARRSIPLHFEGGQNRSVKKYPLLRGKARNKSVKPETIVVTIDKLSVFSPNTTVTVEMLIEKKIINMSGRKKSVKLVSTGEIEFPVSIAFPATKKAVEKIQKAGGAVITI